MRKNKIPLVSEEVRAEAGDVNTLPERLAEIYYRYPTVLAEVIVQNPRTAPELLEKLSETKALQALVARNPNTRLERLYQLWVKHPSALLENAALPLWQLEDPSFWASLPDNAMKAVLSLRSLETTLIYAIWQQAEHFSYQAFSL